MRHPDDHPDPNLAAVMRRVGAAELIAAQRSDLVVAIVAATWNRGIVDRLLAGALNELAESGLPGDRIRVVRVPGAWELPLAAGAALEAGADAVVALGCVIRGETDHYEVIVRETSRALMDVMLATGKPVANGVLACREHAHALARAGFGEDADNKGVEAAAAALAAARVTHALALADEAAP